MVVVGGQKGEEELLEDVFHLNIMKNNGTEFYVKFSLENKTK